MFKFSLLGTVLLSVTMTHAGLEQLNTTELTDVTGQGGADLNWTLSLNHVYATDLTKENISRLDGAGKVLEAFYVLDPAACGSTKQFCRLAIAPNNHVDENGNKKWLVFKGLQGTLQIDKFSVDGTTIINAARKPQTAMQITFYDDSPLKIRNLGFNTVSIETGTSDTEGYENNPTYETYNQKMIDANGNITTTSMSVPTFDKGNEKGFLGVNMHGNLHMSGNLKIFSYNCSGAQGSRC
ncbi:hypothetical protein KTG68_02215 [Acinetobacter variabilis]|uniref:hypothetical protein n=1 Tax=Acinetobacter variabilis TaxID=70346 RepID=UPI0021CFB8C3|nr:hypothetical protein [Acinetobacter variabilis]MCU4310894.1 hypothetical protein [Acinetobacter variabilis]